MSKKRVMGTAFVAIFLFSTLVGVKIVILAETNLVQAPPLVAMPEEYINYTITRVNGSLWAKVDGKYPLHKIFGARDVFELDGLDYAVLSDELLMFYPTPPGTTNISVKMDDTELNWSNYTETHPEATHYTAIGDWPMIYCKIDHIPDYFILTIHYEHPINLMNGSYTFLYDLNISPYLSPWSNKSIAYFSIRIETNYTNLNVYTVRSDGTQNPMDYTITKENTAETITLQIVSEYSKPLLGDLVISFRDPKNPESTDPSFLGTSLPTEYGHAIVVTTAAAAIAILGFLFLKHKKRGEWRISKKVLAVYGSLLLFSTLVGTQLVNLGRANPYFQYVYKGEGPPPPLTNPPTISIFSPQNKMYNVNSVCLSFNVSVGDSKTASRERISRVYYRGDWQQKITDIDLNLTWRENDIKIKASFNLTDIPEGNHRIIVYAIETGRYFNSLFEYWSFSITGSSSVNFTIDTISPHISVLSVENKTYSTSDVPLNFTASEQTEWIGYSLDGQTNVTITGNTTLTGLSPDSHNLTVYAKDTAGNTGASETLTFTIAKPKPQPEPFPTTLFAAAAPSAVVIGLAVCLKFKKKRSNEV